MLWRHPMDQRFDHPSEHSRERQLWCAVIGRAVLDATRPLDASAQATEQAKAKAEAWRWFLENDQDYREACEAAGFDPDVLRKRVLRMAGHDLPTPSAGLRSGKR